MSNNKEKAIPKLPEGLVLNNTYAIESCLDQGGFGITYVGYDINLQRRVAIKEFFFKAGSYRNPKTYEVYPVNDQMAQIYYKERARFVDEGRILAKLNEQPGIVKVITYFEAYNTAYMVMEFIEGRSLAKYVMERGGWLPVNEVLSIMEPVIKSLAMIHQQGVVHRDISPDNVMITSAGKVKLIDFGAAKTKELNMNADRVAKLSYTPPEQRFGNMEIGPHSDVYALCVMLYELISGTRLQSSEDRMGIDSFVPLSVKGISLPPVIDATITGGLELNPENRIKNATDLYYLLYVYAREQGCTPEGVKKKVKESSTKVIIEKMKTENKRRKYRTMYMVIAVMIMLLGSGIILVRSINKKNAEATETGAPSVEQDEGNIANHSGTESSESDPAFYSEALYNYINSKRTTKGIDELETSALYQEVGRECMKEIVSYDAASSYNWNQQVADCVKSKMEESDISGAGWLVLYYENQASTAGIYEDAMAQIKGVNEGKDDYIDLLSCEKIGITAGSGGSGTLYYIIIYR